MRKTGLDFVLNEGIKGKHLVTGEIPCSKGRPVVYRIEDIAPPYPKGEVIVTFAPEDRQYYIGNKRLLWMVYLDKEATPKQIKDFEDALRRERARHKRKGY